jgi:hypothetical protein
MQCAGPTGPEWEEWVARCEAATHDLCEAHARWRDAERDGKRPRGTDLYTEQRRAIVELFHRKCAYCETALPAGNKAGQLDHYRPQGRVRTLDGRVVQATWGAVESPRQHPGYYWLTYQWKNLLPACSACNTPGLGFAQVSSGKHDRFPIADESRYAASPGEEENEERLLLNPWLDDPDQHLRWDPQTGYVLGRTRAGEVTIELLGLNRDGLPEERLKASREVRRELREYVAAHTDERLGDTPAVRAAGASERARLREGFDAYEKGEAEYSAIRYAALRYFRKQLFDRGPQPPRGDGGADGRGELPGRPDERPARDGSRAA